MGAVRDFVLGVKIIDGQGRLLNFGGQVMKNVAGYDVSRLLAGSLGTLGLVVEVSFKVLPIAVAEQTLRFDLPGENSQSLALSRLNKWGGQPLPISASAWVDDVLHVRLEGAAAAVSAAANKLGGQQVAQRWLHTASAAGHQAIRQAAAQAGGHATLFRADPATKATIGVFQPLAAPLARIHRELKTAFDAAGIFNPGRMYAEL